ncbi:ketol-acid reductoisomerase [Pseudoalteromonas shioyasakiensis]|uniref:ketol-acid reductoisomerase n=1 Tax=Pseudoalteromonas TaxID=53246 RepID=UPI000C8A2C51|nr:MULTISPECIES: ketol-acid reductoisomerase [Pseudoalteromonas]MAD05114.1 ketol-acid reductoisomerase [Pseudoalteromonas sp.]MCG9708112.1 ketol-acid reductoisomerase [Pseudoalteromonas sp. Isolate3]MCQ8881913.1 ketol-acid reductoisomerase [Pseudoalteromonas shioyasakiensis]NIZ05933.1 ketol-acid reductoisomerase [Pseudoalteromonas sp. HF66]QLE09845.1 ketol-acid reductoisomerase [Pseudoalteromonas shioyasakiensis]|tara:strand:+ start:54312 stop:55784 length:1473 start_codon:yes stop_codon:yes gene_type:complete|eukprot:gnl/Carplike_NY0171/3575_a4829_451.p1 GENE.gnl/Carplike_NY0171/3575_a4829_451~~gnl/Carplike_NY0171/3575_a4829_451.p1  ORF type:complete len:491 (-),score=53.72 gnl/Carplike_NY0171/3575_a4829_451:56-1528(-)
MANYFNTLPLREQLAQLAQCEFMDPAEFADGVDALKGKKLVIVGCGAQGLNQGLNLRDSGLDVSYTLRESAIAERRQSFLNASENGFTVGTYEELIPTADVVLNLTPDKQHTAVVNAIMPLMKQGATLAYSHGFNIVEEGMQIREDLTVIMVAPKCPGSEVREEYKRGFGVPTLIAVHPENDPQGHGLAQAKAYAAGTGGHRAGVLKSSFIAEVKSDLMGEQTILCGMLQTGSLLCFDKMVEKGIDASYASKLIQYGWEVITEALKYGGVTNMLDRLSNPAKVKAFELSEELKTIMRPLYNKHMDDIISGEFSRGMMADWAEDDAKLLAWRAETAETAFEKQQNTDQEISEQAFFDQGILMVAMVKAGVELAFETMTAAGIIAESAYYESLHETPLIANTIARKKLFEMNRTISDTAEYGCYLYNHACLPLLQDFMKNIDTDVIGKGLDSASNQVDNQTLIAVNKALREHPVEIIGSKLRGYMSAMKKIV